jgi:gliding motility-associated-like protein
VKRFLNLLAFIFTSHLLQAQTQTISENVPFSTTNQSMWGTGGGFNLNINQEIFRFNPTVNFNSGNSGIVNVGGFDFGVGLALDFWMDIGSNFKIEGLTLGTVDVNYPIQVNFDVPAIGTFDKGDTIIIATSYTIDPAGEMETVYPSGGRTSLDLHFGFGINAALTLCAFGCATIPIIPNLELPVQTIDIFALETQPNVSATYPCTMFPCGSGIPCIPDICTTNITPVAIPDNGLGILGEFNLPHVVTVSTNDQANQCITATGQDSYITIGIEIFDFLSNFASRIPPPAGPLIAAVLGNLEGSFPLGFGAEISWTIFSASINVVNTNKQDFKFCPKIASEFNLSSPTNFYVTDASNAIVNSGYDTIINFELGNNIHLHYPCAYEFLNIAPKYEIKNTNNFSNHTYDVISFNFMMSALAFSFTLPDIEIIPELCIDAYCFNFCYPNPSWDDILNISCQFVCTPEICTPALVFDGINESFGPLWEDSIPLGELPEITYFDDSWSLQGFTPVTGTPFQITPRDFSASMTTTNVPCRGDSSGFATVNLTNGSAPFTYAWDNLQTQTSMNNSATMGGLDAGPHYVLVTNRGGCNALGNITLSEPASYLNIPFSLVNDVSCYGGSDGQIGVYPSGGTGAYTYQWTPNVSTTDSAFNLPVGNYLVKVIDANGCDTVKEIIIEQPYALSLTANTHDITCFGVANGSIDLNIAGGSPPFNFSWSNGAISEDIDSINVGSYTVTVTDSKNCVATMTINILGPPSPVGIASNTINAVKCKDGSDGKIFITSLGGTTPYQYQWTNGSNIVLSSSVDSVTNIPSGNYQVLVTDALGCTTVQQYVVNEPSQAIQVVSTITNVSCYGGNDGAITNTVSGGTPGYSALWLSGQNNVSINTLIAGVYNYQILDANNCIVIDSITITEPNQVLTTQYTSIEPLCYGQSNGSISSNTFGGSPPYSYQWQGLGNTNMINNIPSGNYTLTVTDDKQCVNTINITIGEPTLLSSSALSTSVTCFNGNNGGITPYIFQWVNQDSIILNNQSEDITNLEAGNYYLLVTDSNGCIHQSTHIINQPVNALSTALNSTNINCTGNSTGAISSNVIGGTAPYTYQWNNGSTNSSLNNLNAGIYSIIVTDSQLCVDSANIILTEPSNMLMASVTASNVKCYGANDGIAEVEIFGGVPPYQINWSNGVNTTINPSLTPGIYDATITDANGCIANTGIVITEPTNPLSITFIVDSVNCYGGNDGRVSINIAGGSMPYEISWGQSLILMNNINNDTTISNLIAANYIARVIDGNYCIISENIKVNEPLPFSFSATQKPVTCHGGNDGSINIIYAGGIPPYQILWSDSSAQELNDSLIAGYYNVKITDAQQCVFQSNFVQVTEPDTIEVNFVLTATSCTEAKDGEIHLEGKGGVGQLLFEWSTGALGADILELPSGEYVVKTTDANSCSIHTNITLPINPETCFKFANSFTPNGDGKNDTWMIRGIENYPEATVSILNQWGSVVFESFGYKIPWDGTYQGKVLPSATYYYIIKLNKDEPGLTGGITILR